MPDAQRPLSPHLSIYRKQITSVLSIMHRMTGLALVVGTALMVLWLCTAAYRPAHYNELHEMLVSPLGQVCLLGWTVAFYYHFANGIRHLFWDVGMGFTIPQATRSGWMVILFTLMMTAITWGYVGSMTGVQ